MKLEVTFSTDPTGFDKDITKEIIISPKICLYCLHDSRKNIQRFHQEIKNALELKGYNFDYYFKLLKVYTC